MREESNGASCSSRDGNEQERWDGSCCFVVQGVTNTMVVTYVVVTGARELCDLLAEGERGVKDSLDCVQMNKEELFDQAEEKVKKSEFWITAEVGQ